MSEIAKARQNRTAMPALLAFELEKHIGADAAEKLAVAVCQRLDVWPRELADPALPGSFRHILVPDRNGVLMCIFVDHIRDLYGIVEEHGQQCGIEFTDQHTLIVDRPFEEVLELILSGRTQ